MLHFQEKVLNRTAPVKSLKWDTASWLFSPLNNLE